MQISFGKGKVRERERNFKRAILCRRFHLPTFYSLVRTRKDASTMFPLNGLSPEIPNIPPPCICAYFLTGSGGVGGQMFYI